MIRAGALLLLLALPAAKDDPLAGRVAGPSSECIDLDRVQGPAIGDDARTILYPQSRGRIWRTQPIDACPSLRRFSRLVAEVYGRQLCRNDRFTPVDPGSAVPGAPCRFDRFTPYDLPAAAKGARARTG